MTKWNDISTVEYIQRDSSLRTTRELLFWVRSEYRYKGPIVGVMTEFTRKDGSHFISFDVLGVNGHEMDNDFSTDNITHWAVLPEGPR